EEERGTEDVGEAGSVVNQGVAGRRLVGRVELERFRASKELVECRRRRLRRGGDCRLARRRLAFRTGRQEPRGRESHENLETPHIDLPSDHEERSQIALSYIR